jgi:hypothetical protein
VIGCYGWNRWMYDVVQVLVFGVVHETWWPIPLHRFGEITTHSGPTCHTIFIIFFLRQCQPRRAEPTSHAAACCSEWRPLLRPYRPRCVAACSVVPTTSPPPLQSAAPATFPPFSNRSSGLLRCWRGEIRRRRGRIWSPCAELEGVVVLMAGAHGVRWWAGVAACGDRATTEAAHGVRGKEWRRAVNHHRLCLRPCPPRLAPPRRARSVRPRR